MSCELQGQPRQAWKSVCVMTAGLPSHFPPPSDMEAESTRQVGEECMGVNLKDWP